MFATKWILIPLMMIVSLGRVMVRFANIDDDVTYAKYSWIPRPTKQAHCADLLHKYEPVVIIVYPCFTVTLVTRLPRN